MYRVPLRTAFVLVVALPLLVSSLAHAGPDSGADQGVIAVCGDKTCTAGKEFCDTCPGDCGSCTGCQARSKAKCPTCKCEACVCQKDSYCCSDRWDSVCAAQCKSPCNGCTLLDASVQIDGLVDAAPDSSVPPTCGNGTCNPANEFCDTCAKDCGTCDGCKAQQSFGCPGCKCEDCVCKKDSYCCSVQWDQACANICKSQCGGCGVGDLGPPPDLNLVPKAKCGDGKCDAYQEFCDTCPGDCGTCDGCSMRTTAKCPGCKCESCVCNLDSYCCDSQWDSFCASSCKTRCMGCGTTDGGLVDQAIKPPDMTPDTPSPGVCGDGKCNSKSETCDTCEKDCGKCTGCLPRTKPGCPGCACEACVCKLDPDCCKLGWDWICVSECKNNCNGCNFDGGLLDATQTDLPPDAPVKPIDAKSDTTKDLPPLPDGKSDLPPKPSDASSGDTSDLSPLLPDGKTDLPPIPSDVWPDLPPSPVDLPGEGQGVDQYVPVDIYIEDQPRGGGRRIDSPQWECGCAASTPDASAWPLLLSLLGLMLARRRRRRP